MSGKQSLSYWGRTAAIIVMIVVCGAIYSGISAWSSSHAFLVNATESLPNWAFLIEKNKSPSKGDYVFFTPPKDPLVVRHFGENPSPFGKIVYGVPGDVVSRRGSNVYVNGILVSKTKPFSRFGEPLAAGPVGVIPSGCYYVGSPHKDGFDSRYQAIGYACSKAIIGTGRALL